MMRRWTRRRLQRLAIGGLAAALAVAAAGDDGGGGRLSPDRLRWRELHFHAHKLIFTAEVRVRAELVAAATTAAELAVVEGHAGVPPGGEQVVRLELESSMLGRHSSNTALLEPDTAAALQSASRESGRRARFKLQRFTGDGLAITRGRPAEGEEKLPEARWSKRSFEFRLFAPVERDAAPVSDSLALFWVLATAPLERPGDAWRLHLVSDGRLLRVTVKAVAQVQRTLDFDERRGAVKRHVEATIRALELTIDAAPVDPAGAGGDLEFLGMKGSVRIVLDPERRVPLEVSGRVPGAGTVVVRLHDVTLRE